MIGKQKTNKKYTIIFFCILVFVFLTFFMYSKSIQNQKELSFFNENLRILKTAGTIYLKKNKSDLENSLKILSSRINYEELTKEEYRKSLQRDWQYMKESNDCISTIYLGYGDNEILTDDNWQKPEGYQIKKRPWYIEGMKKDGVYWVDTYEELQKKNIVTTITIPIKDKSGKVKGIFAFDIDLKRISEILSSLEFNYANEVYLVNSKGKIMGHSMLTQLNSDLKGTELLKEMSKDGTFYYKDKNKDAYVFSKDEMGKWILMVKIPEEKLKEFAIDKQIIKLIVLNFFLLFLMYIMYMILNISMNKKYLEALKLVSNRESLDSIVGDVEKDSYESLFFNEVKTLQNRIESLEKEILRDEETGLHNEIYLINYGKNYKSKEYKILVIKYLNLSEIKQQYGKNIIELILKRGAMTINALKESEECAVRIDNNTLGVILKNTDAQKRGHYIVDEILNYKWKLHNITLNVFPTLMDFDEYIEQIEKEI